MWPQRVKKIVSGGQTGVDRGGLDAAIALGLPHGGWCPRGRRAEDGPIDAGYRLQTTTSADYRVRTRRNVLHSDGTLLFCSGPLSGGTRLTATFAVCCSRPYHIVDFSAFASGADGETAQLHRVAAWLICEEIGVLNIAGPRESRQRGIAHRTERFLCRLLSEGP